jgi:hypothetical protein
MGKIFNFLEPYLYMIEIIIPTLSNYGDYKYYTWAKSRMLVNIYFMTVYEHCVYYSI